MVSFDDTNKNARLSLMQMVILEALGKSEQDQKEEIARKKGIDPN